MLLMVNKRLNLKIFDDVTVNISSEAFEKNYGSQVLVNLNSLDITSKVHQILLLRNLGRRDYRL